MLTCFISGLSISQTKVLPFAHFHKTGTSPQKNCGFDDLRLAHKKDSNFIGLEDVMNKAILHRQIYRSDTAPVTLPVVFHVVGSNPYAIIDTDLVAALQNLNDAFGKAGVYSASMGVDSYIRFCFAHTDPDGGITNGITRTESFFGEHLNPLIEDDKLKALSVWDPAQYINIWVISSMELEVLPKLDCGVWIRSRSIGYSNMPPGGDPLDGIVVSGLSDLNLIEQMAHYLSLYHTFEGLNCKNNDCTLDGDRVCDTPPDISQSTVSSCSNPNNSCQTDTLSGFTVDMPDLIADFMDNGNAPCHNEFTAGQAQRMQGAVNLLRPGLLISKCNVPCNQNIAASFNQSTPYPLTGNLIAFTNTSTGATSFQWIVNGVIESSAANFSKIFSVKGRYKVTLKAFNGASCFASDSKFVIVTCGVTARFYTNKTQIASKAPYLVDSINFTNISENATSYKWLMRNDQGMNEQVVSTSKNFTYKFLTPAIYQVRLVATNGSCIDTTELNVIPVADPDPNGLIVLSSATCYQETKLRVNFYVCNSGFLPIPPNIPISFYDSNPLLPTSHKLGATFYLVDTIMGKCCSYLYSVIVDVGYKNLNSIYVAFNDDGSTHPLTFPNTTFQELDYSNNISNLQNIAFRVSATPKVSIVEWGDTVQLNAIAGPSTVTSYQWNSPVNLSCTNCNAPSFIADTTTRKTVKATSLLGCTDTTSVAINVPPYNDFTIHINDLQCAKADSLYLNFTLSNSFKRGVLPKSLSVSFYNGDPTTSGAVFLPPVFTLPDTIFAKQDILSAIVKAPVDGGKIYAVVNDSGRSLPVIFPNTKVLEKLYTNNFDDTTYLTDSVIVTPHDTVVLRNQPLQLNIITPIYNAATTLWSAGNGYSLTCTTCPNPLVTVKQNSIIPVKTANRFACIIKGAAYIKILPADMQIKLKEVKCITNSTVQISFSICMNNSYDSVFAGIPISFYDANPDSGVANLLGPVFYTANAEVGNCHTYTTLITTSKTGKIFGFVNDDGSHLSSVPNSVFSETNLRNNFDRLNYIPFTVSVVPTDTSIERLGNIQLLPVVEGGNVTSYVWSPSQFLSCNTCATPIASPRYSVQYILTAKNETNCTDTALVIIRTHTPDGIFIPDAFTPNGDGLNDILYVLGGSDISLVKNFTVFSRWGQKVFEANNILPNNPSNGWDGRVAGRQVETGTYVYTVTIRFANGNEKVFKGTIILIK